MGIHFLDVVVDLQKSLLLRTTSSLVDLGLDLLEELIVLDVIRADAAIKSVYFEFLQLAGFASEYRHLILHDYKSFIAHEGFEVLLDLDYIGVIH